MFHFTIQIHAVNTTTGIVEAAVSGVGEHDIAGRREVEIPRADEALAFALVGVDINGFVGRDEEQVMPPAVRHEHVAGIIDGDTRRVAARAGEERELAVRGDFLDPTVPGLGHEEILIGVKGNAARSGETSDKEFRGCHISLWLLRVKNRPRVLAATWKMREKYAKKKPECKVKKEVRSAPQPSGVNRIIER